MMPAVSWPAVVVKNTFLEVKDEDDDLECAALLVRRPRLNTMPCIFASELQAPYSRHASEDACEGSNAIRWEVDSVSVASTCSRSGLPLAGQVWPLSQDAQGCRRVQEVLGDESLLLAHREALAFELRGHVLEAAVCPYANFVLQKCVVVLPPEAVQFIVDEITAETAASVSSVAQNKFGCRVLQRLLEECRDSQVRVLVVAVLADFIAVAQSPYGNYVVQKIMECGGADSEYRRLCVAQLVEGALGELGMHPFGCIVISTALSKCGPKSRMAITRALLSCPCLLCSMASTRHGHRTVLVFISFLEGDYLEAARRVLESDASLAGNKFGRVVMARLRQADPIQLLPERDTKQHQ